MRFWPWSKRDDEPVDPDPEPLKKMTAQADRLLRDSLVLRELTAVLAEAIRAEDD